MGVPTRYILHQGPGLRAMGEGALVAIRQHLGRHTSSTATPGPELTEVVQPLPPALVRDYVRHVGGDPSTWKRELPPHLFPQWGFGLAARTLSHVPYPLLRVLNGGCRIEVASPLPADEPLSLKARLESIDDDGRRAVLHSRVVTGTSRDPEAVVAHMFSIVPLARGTKTDGPKKDKPRVPDHAREIAFFRLRADAGLEFAKLTGDFNPIHWVRGAARASGFRNVILHGFSTLARAWEAVGRGVYAGDARALSTFDVRFTRPLVLPAKVGCYVADESRREKSVFVGDAVGGPAYLTGTFEARR
jgi:hypothetical protein